MRITVSFGNQYKDLYDRLNCENNKSEIICKALEEYYSSKDDNFEHSVNTRLDLIIDFLINKD